MDRPPGSDQFRPKTLELIIANIRKHFQDELLIFLIQARNKNALTEIGTSDQMIGNLFNMG